MKDLAYYRRLPYTRRLEMDQDDTGRYWVARVQELPGCVIAGESVDAAHGNLDEVFDDYIQAMIDEGLEIPEPERPLKLDAEPLASRGNLGFEVFEPAQVKATDPSTTAVPGDSDDVRTELATAAA